MGEAGQFAQGSYSVSHPRRNVGRCPPSPAYRPGEAYKDAEADLDAAVIRIRKGLTVQRVRVLLTHEVLHTLTDLAGLDKPAGPLQPRVEEAVVNQLAPLLVDVLRRNPALVAYLTAPS